MRLDKINAAIHNLRLGKIMNSCMKTDSVMLPILAATLV